MHCYHVHKFGGTSLANEHRFIALKSLLTGHSEIIVASAIQGTTSALQAILDAAKENNAYKAALIHIKELHVKIAQKLLDASSGDVLFWLEKDIAKIEDILHAVKLTSSYSKEVQDLILGYGEIWSSRILANYLSQYHKVVYLDASTVLFIYENQGVLCVDWEKSQQALTNFLENKNFNQIVITGFIASTLSGKRTTLGRNGSDFSAAIFAKLFKAKYLTIWTDVNGIYTADPRRVRSAFVIESLSYKEALELAYFGAKVLHPMTIAPVLEQNIPIYIKNSLHPENKGTRISQKSKKSSYLIKGITCIDNISLINIEGTGMIGVSGMASRVFQTLHQANVSVVLISQASSEHSICFAVTSNLAATAVKALTDHLQLEMTHKQIEGIHVDKDCTILAVVGDEMVGTKGVSGKLCDTLAKANINIHAISQGSSERNISIVIKSLDATRALQAVHAGFYLSRKTLSIGIIGPGRVGTTLLKQIHSEMERLKESYQVNLYVRGIMNSKQMLLSHTPINLENWDKTLSQDGISANIQEFASHILTDDIPHAVIIDCTANVEIAHQYKYFLHKGIHVITPNKHANAGDIHYYKQLKAFTQTANMCYLYETTVCAGLPVINTLQDIIKTGDKVEKIEGIVSGTLSYIFNELEKGRKFSEIVLEAKTRGYTEPDPREDLSGKDVARKLVCLAREVGFDVSLSDVSVYDLVPESLRSCSVEEFCKKLHLYDAQIEIFQKKAMAKNSRIGYVATVKEDGTLSVAIEYFTPEHPFARLKGTDNMLIFHTSRYHDQPLVIQGPGAGTEVTAAGIFADLLRLVSFLGI